MKLQTDYTDKILLGLSDTFRNEKAVHYFLRALIVYALIKLFFIWPLGDELFAMQSFPIPRSIHGKILLYPSRLAAVNINLFYGVTAGIFLFSLFVKSHYAIRILFFWMMLNFFRVNFPTNNGSDYMLLMLSLWSIPLATKPAMRDDRLRVIQMAVFNAFVIIVQIQICLVYLISGLDKLYSEAWRSGDAFAYIRNIDTMVNPLFNTFLESPVINGVFSWLTIGFELAFIILVWIPRTRIFILCLGVVFHLVIWVMLSLPDFAIIMMLSYMIFLKDSDYSFIRNRFRLGKATMS